MNIIIIGAGGFGRELRSLLPSFLDQSSFKFKGFLANDAGVASDQPMDDLILDTPESYQPQPEDRFLLAIGNMPARRRTVETIQAKGGKFATLVHPTAMVVQTANLGEGVLVYPFACVSNNARLSDFVKLNYYASVGHDTRLGKYCLLAPYATVNGFGTLEDDVYMSTHSTVAPQVHVGARSVISANSAVMKSVKADSFVFGVPGRVTRKMT
jgi:sugar O-acyltransferase (sialic acid O-acetyltransferase NeuD family)